MNLAFAIYELLLSANTPTNAQCLGCAKMYGPAVRRKMMLAD
jgi:hypothetical protein